jgi:hypothetical protein
VHAARGLSNQNADDKSRQLQIGWVSPVAFDAAVSDAAGASCERSAGRDRVRSVSPSAEVDDEWKGEGGDDDLDTAALFAIIRTNKKHLTGNEKDTFLFIGLTWAIAVFLGNYAFYRIGLMSFLPWLNNFMHTFLWIGLCLSYLYLSIRDQEPMLLQCLQFSTFSLVVKYAEQLGMLHCA